LLYTVASVEQHLRHHASGCTPAILKNEGMPEGALHRLRWATDQNCQFCSTAATGARTGGTWNQSLSRG